MVRMGDNRRGTECFHFGDSPMKSRLVCQPPFFFLSQASVYERMYFGVNLQPFLFRQTIISYPGAIRDNGCELLFWSVACEPHAASRGHCLPTNMVRSGPWSIWLLSGTTQRLQGARGCSQLMVKATTIAKGRYDVRRLACLTNSTSLARAHAFHLSASPCFPDNQVQARRLVMNYFCSQHSGVWEVM